MATTTPNYGWTVPTSTDLVKDGATAIETLGDAVDATVFANANAAIAKTIVDAKGDIIAATAADTVSRLAVGANNTVLTADSSTATGLKWAASSSGPTGYTLLNAGGTTLSTATTTVSFSSQKKLWIYFNAASASSAGSDVSIRFNGDSASNYQYLASAIIGGSSWSAGNVTYEDASTGSSGARLFYFSNSANATALGAINMDLTDQTGWKVFNYFGAPETGGSTGQWQFNGQALYKASAAITSISLINSTGNFDAGRVYVYGAN